MESCSLSPNVTISHTSITWAQAALNALHKSPMTSYLRPDNAGALLPWIYTVVLIILHLPVVIIRVVRWEVAQSWCLVSAFLSVILYTQAYVSTQFDPAKILVWTPIILVIDAGSMLQVFFLVIEAKKVRVGDRIVLVDPVDPVDHNQDQAAALLEPEGVRPESSSLLSLYRVWRNPRVQREPAVPGTELGFRDPAIYAALCAALLFIAVLILQLLGLAKAAQAMRATSDPPLVSWCSPILQPFGIAMVDGDCHVYDIEQSATRGIGCIKIPGVWQRQWLKGTIAITCIELITQLIDLLILSLVNGSKKWRGIKMKRPWATIFTGIIVLIVTLLYGVLYSSSLPPAVTTRIMVLSDIEGPASYMGRLTSAGLRGTIIGWNDGLFESWKGTYFGTWLG